MVQHACLACPAGQKKFAWCRGLCTACYQEARKRITAGKTNWAKLVLAGKALPTGKESGQKNRFDMRSRRPSRGN